MNRHESQEQRSGLACLHRGMTAQRAIPPAESARMLPPGNWSVNACVVPAGRMGHVDLTRVPLYHRQ